MPGSVRQPWSKGLAYAIAEGTAPQSLLNRRIVQIEIGTLVAGTSLRGQFEERLIGIVDEVKRAGNVILFIDEIHTIVGAGDTIDSNLDAANILKPALARGELSASARPLMKNTAAPSRKTRRLTAVSAPSTSKSRSEAGHAGDSGGAEGEAGKASRRQHPTGSAASGGRLSVRYLPDRRLPDKALDLLDEACTRVIIRTASPDEEIDRTPEVEWRISPPCCRTGQAFRSPN